MADTHEAESRPTPTRSRPDADSILSGLARMRSGDAAEQVTPINTRDEEPNSDDTDDHGDEEVQAKPKSKAKPAKKPAKPAEPDPDDDDRDVEDELEEPEADPDPEAEIEEIEEPEAAADEEPAEEEPEEDRPDPELERRARQLRKQELRMRERARSEREEIQRDREALRKDREEVEAFKRAKANARTDTAAYLRAAGLTEDDFEHSAKQLYSYTKEAAADPKNREAVARSQRERELQLEVENLKQRLDKQDEGRQQQERVERERQEAIRYMTGVQKAAKPGTLAAHYLGKGGAAAERAMQTLAGITAELAEDDELPLASDVLREYEKRRRAELDDDGVDVDALLKRKAAPPANGKKPAANGASVKNGNGKPAARPAAAAKPDPAPTERQPQRFIDPEERKDNLLRDLTAFREKKRQAARD